MTSQLDADGLLFTVECIGIGEYAKLSRLSAAPAAHYERQAALAGCDSLFLRIQEVKAEAPNAGEPVGKNDKGLVMKNSRQLVALLAVCICALPAACGGGGGGGGGGSDVPTNSAVGGLWNGTISPVNETADEAFGLIAEDGRAYFIDEWDRMYWGTVSAKGSTLTGSLTVADVWGYYLGDDESSYAKVTLTTGTVVSRQKITADWRMTTEKQTYKTGILAFDYDQLYEEDSSLQKIAGNYDDGFGSVGGVINIAANGEIFAQDPWSSCVVNGRVTIINAAYNAYDIKLSFNNCSPDDWYYGASFSGLAFFVPTEKVLVGFTHRLNADPEPLIIVLEPV